MFECTINILIFNINILFTIITGSGFLLNAPGKCSQLSLDLSSQISFSEHTFSKC